MTDFRDLLLHVLLNAAVTSAIGGLLLVWLKAWLERKIDSHFKLLEEKNKAALEIEKTQALNILGRRDTIYPEIVEVVYRLRNSFRNVVAIFPPNGSAGQQAGERWLEIESFNSALYLLTENLYKYRALVDVDIFSKLHRFKSNMQDASVIVNRLTRPEPTSDAMYDDLTSKLRELYDQSDNLYREIAASIQANLTTNSLLRRSGAEAANLPPAADA